MILKYFAQISMFLLIHTDLRKRLIPLYYVCQASSWRCRTLRTCTHMHFYRLNKQYVRLTSAFSQIRVFVVYMKMITTLFLKTHLFFKFAFSGLKNAVVLMYGQNFVFSVSCKQPLRVTVGYWTLISRCV